MPDRHSVIAKTRADLDIADEHAVERVLTDAGAEWIVNAAAYTAVDLAEDEPARAMAVNDAAVGTLARGRCGCRQPAPAFIDRLRVRRQKQSCLSAE